MGDGSRRALFFCIYADFMQIPDRLSIQIESLRWNQENKYGENAPKGGDESMKVLIVLDSCSVDEFRNDPEVREIFASLGPDADIEFVQDTLMDEDDYGYVARMEKEGPEWIEPQKEVMEKLPDADILLVHWHCVNRKMLEAAEHLKFIGVMRSGLEHINVACAQEKGIVVKNCPGRLSNSVADLALAFMIDETRGITRRNLRLGNKSLLEEDKYDDASSRPMCMLKVGLIGFGYIAREVAKRVRACGSTVCAYDPYCSDEVFEAEGVARATFDEVLRQSDIISIHVRLTEESKHMIGDAEFGMMKPNAIFINTARAGLVDEDALIRALETKKIRGAGLDVFTEEPPSDSCPLLHMDNVTSTPHIGGVFNGMLVLSLKLTVGILKEYLKSLK